MILNMDKEIFFHVGLAKTGTTYLQYRFFPYLRGIYYIQRTAYKKAFKIIDSTDYEKYLVSNEFDQQFYREVGKIAARYPSAKLIIVLRRHDSWLASEYKRFVKNGFAGSVRDFLDIYNDSGWWKIEDFLFWPRIQFVLENFKNKPLVLLYDELRERPFDFFDKLAEFTGTEYRRENISLKPVHRSFNEKELKFRRWLNRYCTGEIPEKHDWRRPFQRYFFTYPVRYTVLSIGKILPDFLIPSEPLLDQSYLKEVREFFKDDWEKCLDYVKNENPVKGGKDG